MFYDYVCIEIYTLQLYIIDLTQRGCHTLRFRIVAWCVGYCTPRSAAREVDGTGSGSSPVAGFGTSGTERSVSVTEELFSHSASHGTYVYPVI